MGTGTRGGLGGLGRLFDCRFSKPLWIDTLAIDDSFSLGSINRSADEMSERRRTTQKKGKVPTLVFAFQDPVWLVRDRYLTGSVPKYRHREREDMGIGKHQHSHMFHPQNRCESLCRCGVHISLATLK